MDKIDELLTRRVDQILPSKKALEKRLLSGKKLKIYMGFDPSRPDMHIGHLVGLLTMKAFQDLGHEVIFLIGDFTGRVGDPTGKLKTRQALTEKQVLKNAKTYQDQAQMILNFSGKNPVKLKFNSEWWQTYGSDKFLEIGNQLTVQQLLERDMFQQRLKQEKPIHLSEFLYPLLQGYDSVAMDVDLEIGGTDQTFNMLMGRTLLKTYKDKQKFVLTTQLLVDNSGKKIGKTEGNAINLNNRPEDFYGQIMSLTDEAIVPCLRLATEVSLHKAAEVEADLKKNTNQMKWKKFLAYELIKLLHNQSTAERAQTCFETAFQSNKTPKNLVEFCVSDQCGPADVLVASGTVVSMSQAKRLIDQGAVKVNQKKVGKDYQVKSGDVIRCGKCRFLKIK